MWGCQTNDMLMFPVTLEMEVYNNTYMDEWLQKTNIEEWNINAKRESEIKIYNWDKK